MTSKKIAYAPPEVEVIRVVMESAMAVSAVIQVNEIDWEDGGEISDTEGDIWF